MTDKNLPNSELQNDQEHAVKSEDIGQKTHKDHIRDEEKARQVGWSTEGLSYLQNQESKQRVYVVHPYERDNKDYLAGRSPQARLDEALSLTEAINVDLLGGETVPMRRIKPNTYVGAGKVDELHSLAKDRDIDLFIFDCTLSPIQQRNLEKYLDRKVIDRTALILEIFGDRASTKEGEFTSGACSPDLSKKPSCTLLDPP